VLLVISLIKELLTTRGDGLLAERAVVTEELDVVRLAIGQTVVLVVVRLDEGLVANVTGEVVRMPHLTQGSDGATLARLTALGALLEQQNLIVRRAVEVAFELVAVATLELNTTLFTTEVARVHELALDEEVGTNDGTVAHGALMCLGADDAHFLLHASGAINMLGLRLNLVALTDEVGTTTDANEMLGVEGEAALSIDDLAADNVVADLASLSVKLHEVLLAIELLIGPNKETTTRERLRAILAYEVIRVVVLAKSLGHLTDNGLVANRAIRTNGDVVAHDLGLLLLHQHVGVVHAARTRGDDGARDTVANSAGHSVVRSST